MPMLYSTSLCDNPGDLCSTDPPPRSYTNWTLHLELLLLRLELQRDWRPFREAEQYTFSAFESQEWWGTYHLAFSTSTGPGG